MNGHVEDAAAPRRPARQLCSLIALLAVAMALAACGEGGEPGGNWTGPDVVAPPPPPPPPPADAGRAKLTVTVRDAFGVPAARTYVRHSRSSTSAETNAAGVVVLDVPAGAGTVEALSVGLGAGRAPVDLARDTDTQLEIGLEPPKLAAMSVLSADVVPGSISADGRSLELSVSIAVPAEFYFELRADGNAGPPIELEHVPIVDCAARSGQALAELGPGCIDAGDGTDGAWRLAGTVALGPRQAVNVDPAGTVLLLVDRSQRAGQLDTRDVHLFAAKSLVSALAGDKSVAVGAFAADGGPSGTASPLPEKPVTLYPVENPGWLSGPTEGLEALESLRGRIGGASALGEAVRAGVDYLAARSGAADRPALVVLTAGAEDVCSTASLCATVAREISDLARQAGVQLWLVGPGDNWSVMPSPLVALSSAPDVRLAVGPISGAIHAASELVRRSLQGSTFHQEARFRIESDVAGTFAPGATVLGGVEIANFVNSGMGIWQRLPFRATVPAQ